MPSCGQAEFSSGNSFQALGAHRLRSCLPVLIIIHHLWLPSLLPVGTVWFGMEESYLQSLRPGWSCFNEQHAALVSGQGSGLHHPDGTISGATCPHTGHFHPCLAAGSVRLLCPFLCPLAATRSSQARGGQEVEINVVARR